MYIRKKSLLLILAILSTVSAPLALVGPSQAKNNIIALSPTHGVMSQQSSGNFKIQANQENIYLIKGHRWQSNNGHFLVLQRDGNLVLYKNSGQPIWATGTNNGERLAVQTDGNVVLYDVNWKPLWATDTSGQTGASLYVQTDGNLVVYNRNMKALWAKQTHNRGASTAWKNGISGGGNEVAPPKSTVPALHANPTSNNPLRGFSDPTKGAGRWGGAHNTAYNQGFADDVAAGMGTPVYAMRRGKVVQVQDHFADYRIGTSGTNWRNSNFVRIEFTDDNTHRSGKKYESLYLHLKQGSAKVRVGDIVESGQQIGEIGHNGWSHGPHLHVEVNYSTGSSWASRVTVPYLWDNNRNK